MPTLTLRPTKFPGVLSCKSVPGYSPRLNEIYKASPHENDPAGQGFPGYSYLPYTKTWLIPVERAAYVRKQAEAIGYLTDQIEAEPSSVCPQWHSEALPRHIRALTKLIQHKAQLVYWKPGTGKSFLGVQLVDKVPGRSLIICPKITERAVWGRELEKWGETSNSKAPYYVADSTSKRPLPVEQPNLVVCPHSSLVKLPKHWRYEKIVIDELHYGMHASAIRTQQVLDITTDNAGAYKLGLTGTLISTELWNMHSQLAILWPHRFGKLYQWQTYYHQTTFDGYGGAMQVGPLKPDRIPELLERLEPCLDVVTRTPEDMPTVEREIWWVDKVRDSYRPRSLAHWADHQRKKLPIKVAALHEHETGAEAFCASENTAYVCYLKESAEALASVLPDCTYVSGKMQAKRRIAVLEKANKIAVTMRSIQEGIDLRRFTTVVLVEAYPVPLYLEQVLARFIRLKAKNRVRVIILGLQGTCDEVMLVRIAERLREQEQLFDLGDMQAELQKMVETNEHSDAFIAEMENTLFAGGGSDDLQGDWADNVDLFQGNSETDEEESED